MAGRDWRSGHFVTAHWAAAHWLRDLSVSRESHWPRKHFVDAHWHLDPWIGDGDVAQPAHSHPKHFVGQHFRDRHWIGPVPALLPVPEPEEALEAGGRIFHRPLRWCPVAKERCWDHFCENGRCLRQVLREEDEMLLLGDLF